MRAAIILPFLALVGGCGPLGETMMQVSGWDTVSLWTEPFELNSQGRTFTSTDQMKAGGISSVCVTLKTHYPLAPRATMDRDFEALLHGAKISATLTAMNGKEYRLEGANQAWALNGAISSSEELSACVYSAGNPDVPEGTVIKTVKVQSDRPLTVLGAYWQSMPKNPKSEG